MRAQPSTRSIRLVGATGKIRTAEFDGRDHLVVPVVGLMEAVIHAVNAPTAEFVPMETLAKAPAGWNGRPVVTDHPFVNDQAVSANDPRILETMAIGMLFHTASSQTIAETGRLEFEAWLDPQKADAVGELGQSVIRRLEAGESIEVSVGAIVIVEEEKGNFHGRDYSGRWVEIVPDHLAMLPAGSEGACSNKMGCGARAARHRVLTTATGGTLELLPEVQPTGEASMPSTAAPKAAAAGKAKPTIAQRLMSFMSRMRHNADGSLTDNELHWEIDEALRAVEPGYMGLNDVDQTKGLCYYACMPNDDWQTYQRSFSMDGGAVTLGDDRILVEPVTRYEPVVEVAAAAPAAPATPPAAADQPVAATAATTDPTPVTPPATPTAAATGGGPCKCQTHQSALSAQGVAMHKNAERIKALIASTATPWTDADQTFLEGLTDERLAQFEPAAPVAAAAAAPVAAAPAVAPVAAPVAVPVAAAAAAPVPESEEQFLARAPQSIRDMVAAAKATEAATRSELIATLKAAQTEYSEAELTAMTTAQLERTSRLCAVNLIDEPVDFSARTPRALSTAPNTPPDGYAVALAARKEK